MLILFILLRILFVFKSTPLKIFNFTLSIVLISPSFLYFFLYSINMIKTLWSLKKFSYFTLYPPLFHHPLFSLAFLISSLKVYFLLFSFCDLSFTPHSITWLLFLRLPWIVLRKVWVLLCKVQYFKRWIWSLYVLC